MTDSSIAGQMSSAEAFDLLGRDADAVLLDVRTVPEWQFVGVPDLRPLEKATAFVSWQVYPQMAVHPDFVAAVQQEGIRPEQTVLVICRSGVRSLAAGQALAAAGYGNVINVSDGFEGPLDGEGRRGRAAGWKAAGLPWVQQ